MTKKNTKATRGPQVPRELRELAARQKRREEQVDELIGAISSLAKAYERDLKRREKNDDRLDKYMEMVKIVMADVFQKRAAQT